MKLLKIFIGIITVGVLLVAVSFVLTKRSIENSLVEICDAASERYDCLPRKALLLQLSDENTNLALMNQTIWAIGKMKIEAALPKLEELYDSNAASVSPYGSYNRELEKAIGYMKYGKIDLMSFPELNK